MQRVGGPNAVFVVVGGGHVPRERGRIIAVHGDELTGHHRDVGETLRVGFLEESAAHDFEGFVPA